MRAEQQAADGWPQHRVPPQRAAGWPMVVLAILTPGRGSARKSRVSHRGWRWPAGLAITTSTAGMVVDRHRATRNLRKPFQDMLRKAGIPVWGKPSQNTRSIRETELAERYPSHVVCAWIGNTQPAAREHYLQVTDEHFRRAAGDGADVPPVTGSAADDRPGPEESERGRNAYQKAYQHMAARGGIRRRRENAPQHELAKNASCHHMPLTAAPATSEPSSPSRIRTYNLPVNSRPLYR
jgi:hypothetical protein